MHGGAGALISVGLLRQVPYEHMHKCIQEAYSSGGDGFITECLWEVRCIFVAHQSALCAAGCWDDVGCGTCVIFLSLVGLGTVGGHWHDQS